MFAAAHWYKFYIFDNTQIITVFPKTDLKENNMNLSSCNMIARGVIEIERDSIDSFGINRRCNHTKSEIEVNGISHHHHTSF